MTDLKRIDLDYRTGKVRRGAAVELLRRCNFSNQIGILLTAGPMSSERRHD
jgi:hypothetical protein